MSYKGLLKIGSLMLIVSFLFCACHNKTKDNNSAKEFVSGVVMDNLDTTANPADNFYQFACGGWIKNHPLPYFRPFLLH